MARKRSSQKGHLEAKSGRLTLRYAMRDPDRPSGWCERREYLPLGITLEEAERIRIERMQTINRLNNSRLVQPVITVQAFSETLWPDYLGQRGVKPSTIYSYDSMLKNLVLPSLGRYKMDQVTSIRLTQLFKLAREKYSSKYLLNLYSLLKVMFEVAREYDLVPTSPVRAKLHRPVHERKEKRSYTPEQLRAFTRHVPQEYRLLFFTVGVLGLRLGEVLGLQWQDLESDRLHIQRGIWRGRIQTPKTAASNKWLPLPDVLLELLTGLQERVQGREGQFIFSRPDGTPLDPDRLRRLVLYPALDEAGIERRSRENGFYALRHSAGSLLYLMTRDLEQVKRYLRHSRIGTTSDIYLHDPEEAATSEAIEAMAKVYFEVQEAEGVN
jgi:integrase